jgi:hypothetical protein
VRTNLASAAGMKDSIEHFKRELPGVWTCLTTATIAGVTIPSGARIMAGTPIDGVDVGQLLETQHAQAERNP